MSLPCLPGLHCLRLPTPFSVGDVNVYLIEPARDHERLTLLDTGPHWEPTELALREGLSSLSIRVADLEQIIVSHPHPDHYGLAGKLKAESGATLLAHPNSRPILTQGTASYPQAAAFYRSWLTRCGVPDAVQEQIGLSRTQTHEYALPVQVDRSLDDGDWLAMGGADWQVLAAPGHSGGLVCLFEPSSRILLANDHLIQGISSNPVVEPPPEGQTDRPRRLIQYLHHLHRVAALDPLVAYSGHGEPIADVMGLVGRRAGFHQQRAGRVWQELADGPLTVYELTGRLFAQELPPVHVFLALSEVQGHLDLLEESGQVRSITGDRVDRWTRSDRVR